MTVTITGGGGGSQNLFNTASVANNGVTQAASTFILADAVDDQLTFDFRNLVSGSSDPTNDKIIISSAPNPQFLTRKNDESGEGGLQSVLTTSNQICTWTSNGPGWQSNSEFFYLNGTSNFSYDTTDYEFIQIINQPGLYHFDLQLTATGTNSTNGAQVSIQRVDQSGTVVETIARGTYDVKNGQPANTQIRLSQTWYISQSNIDTDQSYFNILLTASGTGGGISFGGNASTGTNASYWTISYIPDSGKGDS